MWLRDVVRCNNITCIKMRLHDRLPEPGTVKGLLFFSPGLRFAGERRLMIDRWFSNDKGCQQGAKCSNVYFQRTFWLTQPSLLVKLSVVSQWTGTTFIKMNAERAERIVYIHELYRIMTSLLASALALMRRLSHRCIRKSASTYYFSTNESYVLTIICH